MVFTALHYTRSVKRSRPGCPKSQQAVKTVFLLLQSAAAQHRRAAVLFAGAPGTRIAAVAATPPPTPPPIGTPGTPLPTATVFPRSRGHAASPVGCRPRVKPTPSPPPNARKGLDGVWEVQIQHPSGTDYTHFQLTQQGDALTGTYLDARGKKYPLVGTRRRSGSPAHRHDAERHDAAARGQARRHDRHGRHADDARTARCRSPRRIARKRSGSKTSIRRRAAITIPSGGYTPP